MKRKYKKLSALFLILLLLSFSVADVTAHAEEDAVPVLSEDVAVGSRFLELLFGEEETVKEPSEERLLIPGGDVFGVKIESHSVHIADNKEALEMDPSFPLAVGDIIVRIDGEGVFTAKQVKECIKNGRNPLPITVERDGKEYTFDVPLFGEAGNYKIGLTLRDGAAGIGTLTFVDARTGAFGGLGHAISDPESGEPLPMTAGEVTNVTLGGVKKGEAGNPGELHGVLKNETVGTLFSNDERGVFGQLFSVKNFGEGVPVGSKEELKEGEATILSTVKNGEKAAYTVNISDIHTDEKRSRCFTVTVTDKVLLSLTGGIVRGMSGSPVLQDGKLVGAVTHVLISDPKTGYGIFIENMLDALEESNGQQTSAA